MSSALKARRGPNLSTRMPITIRDGIVRATFRMSIAFHWMSVSESVCLMACTIGAWLNQTTNVMKKAIHVK